MKDIKISIDPEDVLEKIDIIDVIDYYGAGNIIDEISPLDIVDKKDCYELLAGMDLEVIKDYVEDS